MDAFVASSLHRSLGEPVPTRRFGDDAAFHYDRANALFRRAYETRTRGAKIKPWIHNGVIVTVLAAEIVSIPILLANIRVMCKRRPSNGAAVAQMQPGGLIAA